ncbi:MAG: sodium:proton antiporter, partial [Planctomycetota bacterium]
MQKYVPFLLLLWMLWLLPRGSSLNAEPRPAGRTTQAGEGGDSAPGEAQMVPSNRQDEVPLADDAGHPREGEAHEWNPPLLAVLPFLLMLLSIAIIPLVNHEWWENDKHRGMVSALLGIPALLFVYLSAANAAEEIDRTHRILHVGEEYVSFIILLGSLFVISGGIVITGNLKGTPVVNTAFLAVGGLLASFIGTTGAAMLLIRPLLTTNSERHHTLHTVIFFIFIVCNCGGCLTPLGDPPLFLGYLKGVPFDWTFDLIGAWTFVVGCLLAIYLALDWIQHRKEKPRDI